MGISGVLSLLTAAPESAGASSGGSMTFTFITFGLIFLIFYFLIIRPQNKQQKEVQKMIASLKKGDKVVTIGGIHGVVQAVKENTVVIKVDDNSTLLMEKSAIARREKEGKESTAKDDSGLKVVRKDNE
ncbi:preprotein translocase subunit YajC [Spirochaetia bacterium 38H-sp]|uniref:Sec translocon accessory complex subunit YajC n=1 Tax=Rarispira pelagica TaxID=3141764 RepID=A0ABU9UCN7_9SPIR